MNPNWLRGNIEMALVWALLVLVLIGGGSLSFFLWQNSRTEEQVPPPVYVNLGKVVAQVGGGRFVRTDVQLQLVDTQAMEVFRTQPQMPVMDAVRRGFAQIPGQDIYTLDGKKSAQKAIQTHLNLLFEQPLVEEVYFSNFLVAGG